MNEYFLIKSAQKGEKEAFQSLITLYYPYVFKFLLKMSGDKALSEDLTQDTFVKLIRNIEMFNLHKNATFATYVITIAKNCYIDYIRRNKQFFLDLDWQELASKDIQDRIVNSMQLEEVLKVLELLPPKQAEAIKMKYLEQQTLQEIANHFGCEPKTIKSRIHNGIVKLRKTLKGD